MTAIVVAWHPIEQPTPESQDRGSRMPDRPSSPLFTVRCELEDGEAGAPRASFTPESYRAEDDTIELRFYNGATMMRRPWFDEPFELTLSLEEGAIRMDRLKAGAPLLDSHRSRSLDDVIGVTVEAEHVGGEPPTARVRLSEEPGDADRTNKIRKGIVRNVSTGLDIYATEVVEATEGRVKQILATDWEPFEISPVPIGADPGAQTLSADSPPSASTAPESNPPAPPAPTQEAATMPVEKTKEELAAEELAKDKIRKDAVEAERARSSEIRGTAARLGLDKLGDELVKAGVSVKAAKARMTDQLAETADATKIDPSVSVEQLSDEHEKRLATVRDYLLHKGSPKHFELTDGARQWIGMSLIELSREELRIRKVECYGMSRMRLAGEAMRVRSAYGLHSTSDFPSVLADVANKSLRRGYELRERSFLPFCSRGTAPDFKPMNRPQMSDVPLIEGKNEHGEFRRVSVSDSNEVYQLATAGLIIGITRKAIVNDDLGAFTRIPLGFGYSVSEFENEVVWGIVTGNPVMGDGINLFDVAAFPTGHQNISSGGAPDVAQLSEMRALMRAQTAPKGGKMRLNMRYLLIPDEMITEVEQLLGDRFVPTTSSDAVPASMRQLEPIAEPLLSDASPTEWYGVASPDQIDTIEYSYLEGEEGPYTESRVGWETDGVEQKVRLDFAAKALEWRSFVKNPG